jgi:fluoroacetyl-CoA thioesterase
MQPIVGSVGRVELLVTDASTAAAVGSGLVPGLSTPTMVSLMEGAAIAAIDGQLEPGTSTVGTRIDVEHLAPTPVGMRVVAQATLEAVEGRRLTFAVGAADEVGEIGRGSHVRHVIDLAPFAERLRTRTAP